MDRRRGVRRSSSGSSNLVPGPELHRGRDARRPCPRGLARPARRRRRVHPARVPHDARARLALRAVRHATYGSNRRSPASRPWSSCWSCRRSCSCSRRRCGAPSPSRSRLVALAGGASSACTSSRSSRRRARRRASCGGSATGRRRRDRARSSVVLGSVVHEVGPVVATAGPVMLAPLFFVFLEIGAVLYGSGYVLYAFLESQLVHQRHWISEQQLVDAIAIGQLTPGSALHHRDVRRLPRCAASPARSSPPSGSSSRVLLRGRDRRRGAAAPRQRRVPCVPERSRRGVDRTDGVGRGDARRPHLRRRLHDRRRRPRPRRCSCCAVPIPVWLLLGGAVAGLLIPRLG